MHFIMRGRPRRGWFRTYLGREFGSLGGLFFFFRTPSNLHPQGSGKQLFHEYIRSTRYPNSRDEGKGTAELVITFLRNLLGMRYHKPLM